MSRIKRFTLATLLIGICALVIDFIIACPCIPFSTSIILISIFVIVSVILSVIEMVKVLSEYE